MRLKKIIKQLEGKFPLELAEEWDNVGLLLDSTRREIKSIMLCLDITRDVVDKAVANKVDLIISHHPFIFYPLKKITTDEVNGEKILKLARNNIAVYSMHTNIDSGIGGLNDFIIKKIGQEGKVFAISNNRSIELRKLVTSDLIDAKDKIINPLRIQKLKSAITIEELCKIIKEKLCIPNVRVVGDTVKLVKSYAICTGSGMSFSGNVKKKADVFITGDLKYHESLDASELNQTIIDLGHYESEYLFVELLEENLKTFFDGTILKEYGQAVFKVI
mgnify:FL=1